MEWEVTLRERLRPSSSAQGQPSKDSQPACWLFSNCRSESDNYPDSRLALMYFLVDWKNASLFFKWRSKRRSRTEIRQQEWSATSSSSIKWMCTSQTASCC